MAWLLVALIFRILEFCAEDAAFGGMIISEHFSKSSALW